MDIKEPDQITPEAAKALRAKSGLTQEKFWGAVGVSKPRASNYENGKYKIDKPVRILLYLHYVCGLPTQLTHEELMSACGAAKGFKTLESAACKAEEAMKQLKSAKAHISGGKR